MARGQKQAAEKNLETTNAVAAGERQYGSDLMAPYQNRSAEMYGLAQPTVQQMLQRPGYSDAAKSTMRNDVLGGVTSAYDATARNAENRATRTGNAAGQNELAAELARSKSRDVGQATGGLDLFFENEANRQKEAGLSAASSLYGISNDTLANLYGTRSGTVAQLYGLGPATLGSRAAGGGWTQGFSDVAGALKPKGYLG